MPVPTSYPGVYIEELPSGVRTITGVATSVAAFIGYFRSGPMDEATQIFNLGDFQRIFGGLHTRSEASYAIQQFFLNGGTEAWVVRTAGGAVEEADVAIQSTIGGPTALTVTAASPGVWGNELRVMVSYPGPTSNDRFNLTFALYQTTDGERQLLASETFNNLSMNPAAPTFVHRVVNDELAGSKLVEVTANGNVRPQPNGTLSGVLAPFPALTSGTPQLDVTIGTEGTATATLTAVPTTLAEARARLEAAIRAANPASRAFAQAQVNVVDNRLHVLAGGLEHDARITFAAGGADTTAGDLQLITAQNLEGVLSGDISGLAFPTAAGLQLRVAMGGGAPQTLTLGAMNDPAGVAAELEAQIRTAGAGAEFTGARVALHSEAGADQLVVVAGIAGTAVAFSAEPADTTVDDLGLDAGTATVVEAAVSGDINPVPAVPNNAEVQVTLGGDGPHTATFGAAANALGAIADELQAAIRGAQPANPATFTDARVAAYSGGGDNRLVALAGVAGDAVIFTTAPADATTAGELLLDAANAQANVQQYALGAGAAIAATAQGAGTPGNDGDPPGATEIIGDFNAKTGLYALEDVDLFNLLCIPRASVVSGDDALHANHQTALAQSAAIITAATNYCEQRRAFLLVDPPSSVDAVQEAKDWLDANAGLRRANAALYFPRVRIPDPLDEFRLRTVGPCGTIAGLYARTDGARGVWKAPAGTEASLTNVQQLEVPLSNAENGTLNPLAINCLRNFPVYGRVCWGARTLVGSDQQASQWKYVPVRRLALFIEESLFRGTQWVVFEPNDEPLWAQIRLNIGAFMQGLFRQGAFQGSSPKDAYLVKCDHQTTTQDDINRGVVNILVGFAPLKPAEFVIIQIQQLAGQIEA
jgi:phage tail sheath protein FI